MEIVKLDGVHLSGVPYNWTVSIYRVYGVPYNRRGFEMLYRNPSGNRNPSGKWRMVEPQSNCNITFFHYFVHLNGFRFLIKPEHKITKF